MTKGLTISNADIAVLKLNMKLHYVQYNTIDAITSDGIFLFISGICSRMKLRKLEKICISCCGEIHFKLQFMLSRHNMLRLANVYTVEGVNAISTNFFLCLLSHTNEPSTKLSNHDFNQPPVPHRLVPVMSERMTGVSTVRSYIYITAPHLSSRTLPPRLPDYLLGIVCPPELGRQPGSAASGAGERSGAGPDRTRSGHAR